MPLTVSRIGPRAACILRCVRGRSSRPGACTASAIAAPSRCTSMQCWRSSALSSPPTGRTIAGRSRITLPMISASPVPIPLRRHGRNEFPEYGVLQLRRRSHQKHRCLFRHDLPGWRFRQAAVVATGIRDLHWESNEAFNDEARHVRPCAGHPRLGFLIARKSWMAGTPSAKTRFALLPGHDEKAIFSSVPRPRNYLRNNFLRRVGAAKPRSSC